MLITISELKNKFNINIAGILHIGAHTCEELSAYLQAGVNNENIYWIEALPELVERNKKQNNTIKIYQAVISDKDDDMVIFNITKNDHTGDSQSSSILEFGSHETSHPQVKMVDKRMMKTSRLESVIEKNNTKFLIDPMSEILLLGTTIDYVSEDYDKGIFENKFIFITNKYLASSCGCGISFTPK